MAYFHCGPRLSPSNTSKNDQIRKKQYQFNTYSTISYLYSQKKSSFNLYFKTSQIVKPFNDTIYS